jgi:hypothetical protein
MPAAFRYLFRDTIPRRFLSVKHSIIPDNVGYAEMIIFKNILPAF